MTAGGGGGAKEEEACPLTCPDCQCVGNIWTYLDCKGNYREPYVCRVAEPALGADGDEHVQPQAVRP